MSDPRLAAWALTLAALAALSGCAVSGQKLVADSKAALDRTPVCCSSLAGATRVPLPTASTDVAIGPPASQAFDFGGNKAYFALFQLPPFKGTYSLRLTSVAQGMPTDVALFIPRVATYDEQFRVVRFFDEKTLRNRDNDVERTIFFNPSNADERYLAVFGSDLSASIERAYSVVTVTPVVAGPVIFNMVSGVDGKSILRSSPAGVVRLEVQGPAAAPAR